MQFDAGSPVSGHHVAHQERNKTVWPKLLVSPLKLARLLGTLSACGRLKLKMSSGNRSDDESLTFLGCSGHNLCARYLIQKIRNVRSASYEREHDR
ncbi:hypothetical protein MTO96_023690 [Rhipicephalus appendiculatus]